jgi:hypothetical protein
MRGMVIIFFSIRTYLILSLKMNYVFSSPSFWWGLLLIPITALLADVVYNW